MIDVKVYNLDNVLEAVNYAKKKLQTPTEPLQEIADFYKDDIRENFEQERSPDGMPWARLAPSTVRQKRTSYILRETFALFNAIKTTVQGNEVRIGVDLFYAIFHQKGTNKIPARPFLGVSDRHYKRFEKIVTDWVKRIFKF